MLYMHVSALNMSCIHEGALYIQHNSQIYLPAKLSKWRILPESRSVGVRQLSAVGTIVAYIICFGIFWGVYR